MLIVPRRRVSAYDADAQVYISAVEAADGQALEAAVKDVINAFVVGCKADGIWAALKACCILAGARTLNGCLVPLVGAAPTRFGTEGGWNYNRETGLAANGTNNYLDSNRSINAQPQNSLHLSTWLSSALQANTSAIGAVDTGVSPVSFSQIISNGTDLSFAANSNTGFTPVPGNMLSGIGLLGANRGSASQIVARVAGVSHTATRDSTARINRNAFVFCRNLNGSPSIYTSARFAFYSIGESLDLALLNTRVTALINAIAAAIP